MYGKYPSISKGICVEFDILLMPDKRFFFSFAIKPPQKRFIKIFMQTLSYKYFGDDILMAKLVLILFLLWYAVCFPTTVSQYTKEAVLMCASLVVPSIFLFSVISKMLAKTAHEIKIPNFINKLYEKLFHLPSSLLPLTFPGFISASPACSFALGEAYKDGLCTKDEAERFCVLCNNCSYSFVTGVVSFIVGSQKTALLLFFSNFLSTITVFFLFFRPNTKPLKNNTIKKDKIQPSSLLTQCILSSTTDIVSACGYIVFFYTLTNCFTRTIRVFFNENSFTKTLSVVISIFLELTSGITSCSSIEGYARIMLVSCSMSFLGISAYFQVKYALQKYGLNASFYIKSKLLCALFCPVYTLCFLFVCPVERPVFSGNNFADFDFACISHKANFCIIVMFFAVTVGAIISKLRKITKRKAQNVKIYALCFLIFALFSV